MHAPDGFLNAGTSVATGVVSAGAMGAALRQTSRTLQDRQVPLAGLSAAFIFAAQMFNFPVAGGTSGHLLGGALAAILLGPATGAIVVSVVVVIQALAFADGGLTALGYNTLNMAIVPAFGGYAVFRAVLRIMPKTTGGVAGATGIAGLASVVMASAAFSIEWLFGATAPVPFDTVFGAMVGVHLLIGIGEGILSAMAIGAVLAARPDLVFAIQDVPIDAGRRKVSFRTFGLAAVVVAVLMAAVVSQFAASTPDGLERVAEDTGIAASARDHPFDSALFSDYATAGIDDPTLSLAVAGIAGTILALAVGSGVLMALRARRRPLVERRG